jgi:7-cyano-7-deazaguanine synthase
MKKAVVLLSGGLDSATTVALAQEAGFTPYALTIFYGQRHQGEVEAARRVAAALGVAAHQVFELNLRSIGGSALTADIPVPKGVGEGAGIPVTYVPARNTIFLSIALGWAEVLGVGDLFIGVNAVDYSGYPDCRPEFIEAFEKMGNLATKGGVEKTAPVRIHAPLIHKTKAEIIREGIRLGVDYSLTTSCYDPGAEGIACGACDACMLRQRGFAVAGLVDPIPYQVQKEGV